MLKIRSRFGDRFLRFFGDFGRKPQKRAKKFGLSSSWWSVAGLEAGELLEDRGPCAGFRSAAGADRAARARVPPAADEISPHKRPSLVDLVPGCRVLVPRARRDLPVFRGFRAETRGSRIELHGARYVWRGPRGPGPGMIHWEKDKKNPPGSLRAGWGWFGC